MTAREWLASVTSAVKAVKAEETHEELARLAATRLGSPLGDGVRSPNVADKMAAVDAYLDGAESSASRKAEALAEIARAREVFDGLRSVGWMEAEAANVLEAVHIGMLTKREVAAAAHESYATVRRRYSFGVDWLDSHGIAHARAGIGAAT